MTAFAAFGMPREPVADVIDLRIQGPAGDLPLRLYAPMPEGGATPLPALVYLHGGSFVAGGLDSHDTLLRALANRAGCLVVSVAYRLAPEHPYPAATEDAWAALAWVAGHAHEMGVDGRRLAVGGDSAGGLLAASVAQRANESGLTLRLQVLLYPNLDATVSSPSWRELGSGAYIVSRARMMAWFDAYLPPGVDRRRPDVSPIFANNVSTCAPALIVTADHDPLRDEGEAYAAKLRDASVPVDHACWPGMIHGFASMAGVLDAGRRLIDDVGVALRQAYSR
ncbi:MAG: alpha/beta hydrolase [Janthinobacterium lividum]